MAAMASDAPLPGPSGLVASAGSPGLLIASAVALLALPSVVLGFTLRLDSPTGAGTFAGDAVNAPVAPPPGLARTGLSLGAMARDFFRFTPAGLAAHLAAAAEPTPEPAPAPVSTSP